MVFLVVFFLCGVLFGFLLFLGRYSVESRIYFFKEHLRSGLFVALFFGVLYFLVGYFLIGGFVGFVSFLFVVFVPVMFASLGAHLKAQKMNVSESVVSFSFLFGSFLGWFSLMILIVFSYFNYANISSPLLIILGVLFACWTAYALNIVFVVEANMPKRASLSLPPTIASPSAVDYAYQIVYGYEIFPPVISILMLVVGIFVLLTVLRGG